MTELPTPATPRTATTTTPHNSVSPRPSRHERYYFEDAAVFLVQDTLFKIPRHMLVQESPIFADMFRLPTSSDAELEGRVDAAPIRLAQVEVVDFERLLELLYPLKFSAFTTGTVNWGEAEWTSVLHLASRWQMLDVRSAALASLSPCITPTAKIALGRTYDHPPWVRDGFLQLCMRPEPLAMKDTTGLSPTEILGVAEARERIRLEAIPRTRQVQNEKMVRTKYGQCGVYQTSYLMSEEHYRHPQVHLILDEIFDIPEPFLKP